MHAQKRTYTDSYTYNVTAQIDWGLLSRRFGMNNDSSVSPWPNMEAVLIWRVHVLQLKWIYVERPPLFLLSVHRRRERANE